MLQRPQPDKLTRKATRARKLKNARNRRWRKLTARGEVVASSTVGASVIDRRAYLAR
jgi:hypothetical protein